MRKTGEPRYKKDRKGRQTKKKENKEFKKEEMCS